MSRNIVRVNKTKNYTVMSNYNLRDTRLSWKAKGIHSYILSLPDDWKVILEHLKTMATDGEASMRSGLKELYDLCYWQKYPVYVDGVMDRWITEIYEEPFDPTEKIKSITIRKGIETINYIAQSKETSLLGENLKVGNLEVTNSRLLSTNNTKDLFVSNHSLIQDDGMNEILNKIDINRFEEKKAITQAIRMLYYSNKGLIVNNMTIPYNQVREDLRLLTSITIANALNDFYKATEGSQITNVTAYLSKCIYNSIFDSELKISADINYTNSF